MTRIIQVDDAADPALAPYRSIRERDLVGRHGRFVAEGKVVLRMLLASQRFEAESVLVLDRRLAGLDEVLACAPRDLPVYVAPQAVIDAVAGFHIHRGILAVGRRGVPQDADGLLHGLASDTTVVVLVGLSNHDNVGAIFRNAAALRADAILLDEGCCDPLYRKAIRVSVGAALTVPFARGGTGMELTETLEAAGFRCLALSPAGTLAVDELRPGGRNALFLGTEGEGLPDVLLSRMERVRIPMSREIDSLNVASASAIALHRLYRG